MQKFIYSLPLLAAFYLFSCGGSAESTGETKDSSETIELKTTWEIEAFADVQVLSYEIPGFDSLTVKQKTLVYYLYEAGLSGRDMIWDQNYRYNLQIRNALENIVRTYEGDKSSEDWNKFMVYTKRVWFSNGIHHHYSMDKFLPEFSQEYFQTLLSETSTSLDSVIVTAMFDPTIDMKRVSQDTKSDLITSSAMNFYGEGVTEKDVENFYKEKMANGGDKPIEFGLNSKLVKNPDGTLTEQVWKVGGMYSEAITEVVYWLKKAQGVAENDKQAKALGLLVEYYETGDLQKWSEYNIAWAEATEGDIDYIQGFVEVYGDPMHMRGTYESIVQLKDFEASARMKTLEENVQWFEDNSSIMDQHKKKNVVGVTYKVVNVAGESGDASPSTPIGVNLPNANWIRTLHGSKSVSLGNLVEAYDNAGGDGLLEEFANDAEEIDLAKKHSKLAAKLHTA
ncbi:MAG: dihydrofolate reductase, partial [Crocinitomicaceae bacterium]|nr:dihydrofolate reductase [Crocinitomicaceae bacterium]